MRITTFILIVGQVILITSISTGQDLDTIKTNINMPEIQVARTKDRTINKTPLSLSVIRSDNMLFDGNNTLDNILRQQTGITITTTLTGNQGMQLQGLDASYIAVLIDGFPLVGRTFGELDLRRISLSNIEKIEILKGASSSLYGSDALAGVLNIITKSKTNNGTDIDLNVSMGSNYTINPNLAHRYKNNNFQISSSLDYYQTNGYDLIDEDFLRTVNPSKSYTISSKLKYIITKKLLIKSTLRYYTQDQIHKDIYSSKSGETKFLEGEREIIDYNIGGSLKYNFNSHSYQEAEFYTTQYNIAEFLLNQDESIFEESTSNHALLHFESRTHYSKNNIHFILGLGKRIEEVERQDFFRSEQQGLQFSYLQIDTDILSKIRFIAGIRHDYYNDDNISRLSNKFAIGSPLTKKIYLSGSIGTGFKMPDFRQRYFNFTNLTQGGYTVLGRDIAFDMLTSMQSNGMISNFNIPLSEFNTPLKPEESININLGLSYQHKKIDASLNIFNNKIINLIDYQLVAEYENKLTGVYTYFNVNEVETKGLEFNMSFHPNTDWTISTGYQLLYAYDIAIKDSFANNAIYARDQTTNASFKLNTNDYFGLFNRSRHTGNLSFFYNMNKKVQFNSVIRYRTKYGTAENDNGNEVLDKYDNFVKGYAICDLGIRYHLPLMSLQFGVKNIFGFTNPDYISNISGRFYYINLLFKLIKTKKKYEKN